MNNIWLGIDTSNYTTSVSAVDADGKFYNIKIPLCVKPNEKGVRQSDAVFMHVKNIPEAMKRLMDALRQDNGDELHFSAVGVSTRPRSVDGSYMPCFLSGISAATSVAQINSIPMYEFSHQEGHIRAALFGAGVSIPEHFYSFHLSGGTCELLEVIYNGRGFQESIIAESADITLGQLVDRTGVMLGLRFPCGAELEKLALRSDKAYKIKIAGENRINLSGFENKTKKMLTDGELYCDIAAYVYDVITAAVQKLLDARKEPNLPVIFAGGVSGSKILSKRISSFCEAYFAEPALSSDNAVGIALLTKENYLECNNE